MMSEILFYQNFWMKIARVEDFYVNIIILDGVEDKSKFRVTEKWLSIEARGECENIIYNHFSI